MTSWMIRLNAVDVRLCRVVARTRMPVLSAFMRLYTHLGDPLAIILTAVVLLLVGGTAPGSGAVHSVTSTLVAFFASQLLKRWIQRPRPALGVGLHSLVEAPDRFSFPSGHAAATLAMALPLALALPTLIGVLVVAAALLVGVSRCYLGVHYPGDVLAGWGLAVGAVIAVGLA